MVNNNDSLERVEDWGEVLADVSQALEERQSQNAIEATLELPECYEGLENQAAAVTPKQIGDLIKPIIEKFASPSSLSPLPRCSDTQFRIFVHRMEDLELDARKVLIAGFPCLRRIATLIAIAEFLPIPLILGAGVGTLGFISAIALLNPLLFFYQPGAWSHSLTWN